MRPIVALVTDFGSRDHYVGAVKGAILAAAPEATIVDVLHEVESYDVLAGALALQAAYRSFPAGAAFLAVVDPGVGTDRRGIAVDAGGYRFVGPDNGLLSLVLADHPDARVHSLTNRGLHRYSVSPVFHARDVFAPVAGRLAAGMPIDETGVAIQDPVLLELPEPRRNRDGSLQGEVLHVDRFGNLVCNLGEPELLSVLEPGGGDPTELVLVVESAVLALVRTYADVAEGEACALVGSSGRVEIAANKESASRLLGAAAGAPVVVRRALSGVL